MTTNQLRYQELQQNRDLKTRELDQNKALKTRELDLTEEANKHKAISGYIGAAGSLMKGVGGVINPFM